MDFPMYVYKPRRGAKRGEDSKVRPVTLLTAFILAFGYSGFPSLTLVSFKPGSLSLLHTCNQRVFMPLLLEETAEKFAG